MKKPTKIQRCKEENCNRIIGSRNPNKSGLCTGCYQIRQSRKKTANTEKTLSEVKDGN
ncbi:hypothetical protein LCGC14_0441870 [marine sediment metagenome]|uniref:Uncharacterized protein n=1 Tax=marine sediment metagenome TaxID=412755 RepID=A0A0F9VUC9_9ZZZZ